MRIANVVLNDFTRDNRVLKVAALLQKNGADVTVVALHRPNLPSFERHETHGFAIQRVSILSPKHRLFFAGKVARVGRQDHMASSRCRSVALQ